MKKDAVILLNYWYLNNPMVVKYGDVVMDDMKVLYSLTEFEDVELSHYTAGVWL